MMGAMGLGALAGVTKALIDVLAFGIGVMGCNVGCSGRANASGVAAALVNCVKGLGALTGELARAAFA